MDILFLEPAYKNYIWGGNRLKKEFDKNTPYEITAESWEISTNKNGNSIVVNGDFKGKKLQELFEMTDCKSDIFGEKCIKKDRFPILIKFIDAKNNLSVQVHPDDIYAQKNENDIGKSEMWYIMDCPKDAKIICGLDETIKTKQQLKDIINSGNIKEYLQYIDIEKGDSIYIPAGTIHAITSGILICEIQQNSDLTYRVYDWDRVDKNGNSRELHIKQAIDVINLKNKAIKVKTKVKEYQKILDTGNFKVDKLNINGKYLAESNEDTFYAINILDGEGRIYWNNKEHKIKKGDSFIIPANIGKYKISGNLIALKTYL